MLGEKLKFQEFKIQEKKIESIGEELVSLRVKKFWNFRTLKIEIWKFERLWILEILRKLSKFKKFETNFYNDDILIIIRWNKFVGKNFPREKYQKEI